MTVLLVFSFCAAQAEEGMWTFDNFPTKPVYEKYGFEASPIWLEHVRQSAARLAGGCSGSFVSSSGLILTNHHCAHRCIEQLSNAKKDFVAKGFYAKTNAEEVRCPEIEINRLVQIIDVTSEIQSATAKLTGEAFNKAQKAEMSKLEKECSASSDKVRCDVVTLYHGGRYNLYKYQRYQDVRLVFAPEFAIAFFGGDPDNFTFPRYDLDMAMLRVYEDGKPLQNKDYFKWSKEPAKDGDLSFVVGHPGNTSRLYTMADLETLRNTKIIQALTYLSEVRGLLTEYSKRSPEQKRIAKDHLFGVENSLKALKGRYAVLLDKRIMGDKEKAENEFRQRVNGASDLKKAYGDAWEMNEKANIDLRNMYARMSTLESNFGSRLFEIAKTLVRAGDELPKKNEVRYREYADSRLPQLKQSLFSKAPIYSDFETAMLEFNLTKAREVLGPDDPAVKALLGKKSPADVAKALVQGTKLKDIKLRQSLYDGGKKAITASKDPMIQFALLMDPYSRKVRDKFEDDIEPNLKLSAEKIAQAHFAVEGTNTYPDATFTLRVSYGQIKGYDENGVFVPPITDYEGAFQRNTGADPFALPASWINAKSKLNMQTPLNFCATADIIGGNSGSPVINRNGEIIGLIFDGNIQSLGGDYIYDATQNRAVAVHSAGIIEALDKIYGAKRIKDELLSSANATVTTSVH
jgi:V8-like Glu-specific endopeptidase